MCTRLYTIAMYKFLLWLVPNNLGPLGLDLQFIYTLGWAYLTVGGPKKVLVCVTNGVFALVWP